MIPEVELLREAARRLRAQVVDGNPNPWTRPGMDTALAAWLDAEADVHEMCATADAAVRVVTEGRFRVNALESTLPQAVAVARAVLGREAQ